jgi:hypothetical protein
LDLINKNPIEIKEPNLIKIMRYYKEVIVWKRM